MWLLRLLDKKTPKTLSYALKLVSRWYSPLATIYAHISIIGDLTRKTRLRHAYTRLASSIPAFRFRIAAGTVVGLWIEAFCPGSEVGVKYSRSRRRSKYVKQSRQDAQDKHLIEIVPETCYIILFGKGKSMLLSDLIRVHLIRLTFLTFYLGITA